MGLADHTTIGETRVMVGNQKAIARVAHIKFNGVGTHPLGRCKCHQCVFQNGC
jgi:hypothetical protein